MREGRGELSPLSTNQEAAEMENLTEQDSALRTNFRAALMRLLTNKLYMWNFFSSIFIVFAFMGFGTFMPKYVEYQFRSADLVNFLKIKQFLCVLPVVRKEASYKKIVVAESSKLSITQCLCHLT
jgi:hypothetical protein